MAPPTIVLNVAWRVIASLYRWASRTPGWSAAEVLLVPAGAVTVMSTVPAEPAGAVAAITVGP